MALRHSSTSLVVLMITLAPFPTTAQTKWRLPATIEAVQDISAQPFETQGQARGVLYVGRGNSFTIKKGERFLMVTVGAEGGCRIEFNKKQYHASSCPWLDGFTDHQQDFFKVVSGRSGSQPRERVRSPDGQPNIALHPAPAAAIMSRRG